VLKLVIGAEGRPAQQMSRFWLTYGSADRLAGVVIVAAPSMFQAHMNAAGPPALPSPKVTSSGPD
jgi:hypothetical protein